MAKQRVYVTQIVKYKKKIYASIKTFWFVFFRCYSSIYETTVCWKIAKIVRFHLKIPLNFSDQFILLCDTNGCTILFFKIDLLYILCAVYLLWKFKVMKGIS